MVKTRAFTLHALFLNETSSSTNPNEASSSIKKSFQARKHSTLQKGDPIIRKKVETRGKSDKWQTSGDTCTPSCGNTQFTLIQNSDMWQPRSHTNRRESVGVRWIYQNVPSAWSVHKWCSCNIFHDKKSYSHNLIFHKRTSSDEVFNRLKSRSA